MLEIADDLYQTHFAQLFQQLSRFFYGQFFSPSAAYGFISGFVEEETNVLDWIVTTPVSAVLHCLTAYTVDDRNMRAAVQHFLTQISRNHFSGVRNSNIHYDPAVRIRKDPVFRRHRAKSGTVNIGNIQPEILQRFVQRRT